MALPDHIALNLHFQPEYANTSKCQSLDTVIIYSIADWSLDKVKAIEEDYVLLSISGGKNKGGSVNIPAQQAVARIIFFITTFCKKQEENNFLFK